MAIWVCVRAVRWVSRGGSKIGLGFLVSLASQFLSISPLNFSFLFFFVHLFFRLDWVYILFDLHFCFLRFTWAGLIVHDFGEGPSYKVRGA